MIRHTIRHVKRNDVVQVMSGKDKGKTGKVLRVIPKSGKVVVEKINMVKRHSKATQKGPGGITEKEAPIPACIVLPYADKLGKGIRISHKLVDDGKKVRFSSKHGIEISK